MKNEPSMAVAPSAEKARAVCLSGFEGVATATPPGAHAMTADSSDAGGYWCLYCNRELPSHDGVVVHDNVPHPAAATYDEQERPQ